MRKLLVALLLFTTTLAVAENWQMIIDSTDDSRLLVDTESITLEGYVTESGDNSVRVYATMKIFTNEQEVIPMIAVIDGTECVKQQGGQLEAIIDQEGNGLTYFWSMDGGKLYDSQGQFLCGYFMGTLKQYSKDRNQDNNPKITM